jgi:DNA-binding NarL/FixJ family response regulator
MEFDHSFNHAQQEGGKIRVVVIDDHPAIREALAGVIGSKLDMTLCGDTDSAEAGLLLIERTRPNVAVVDVSLRDTHGLDLVGQIRTRFETVQVVVYSMFEEHVYAERAIRAGALSYLMKSESAQRVAEAIRSVHRGQFYLSRAMASRILGRGIGSVSGDPGFAIDALTERENAVFRLLGEGYTLSQIAERLGVSEKTVQSYRRRAKEKLGLGTVAELMQFATRWVGS